MNIGIAYNPEFSHAAGGGGWIGSLIEAIGGLGEEGIKLGGTKIAADAATQQAKFEADSLKTQALYGAAGNDQASSMLAAALAAQQANRQPKQQAFNTNYLFMGLIGIAAIVAIIVVLKQ